MDWLNLAFMLAAISGHLELMATFVNRSHAFPIHLRPLRTIRHLDDALVVLFPVSLFWFQGVHGVDLLHGGSPLDLPVGWKMYLGLCTGGFVGLVYSTLRWQFTRVPRELAESSERTLDLGRESPEPLTGDGPYHLLTRIPLNELLQLSVTRKTIRLRNLPEAWDGLTITHLTDLHYSGTIRRGYFERVIDEAIKLDSDLAVFTGDLIDSTDCIDWIEPTLGRLRARLGCYSILGNHDWDIGCPESIRQRLSDNGWIDVASRIEAVAIAGQTMLIGGSELPWMGNHPDFLEDESAEFRLFLSHTPDHIFFAREHRVDLMLSGHNHGGQIILPVIGPIFSPSRYGVRFSAGTFVRPPTVLHVSRGISAKHAWRWRCRPELAQLTLRKAG